MKQLHTAATVGTGETAVLQAEGGTLDVGAVDTTGLAQHDLSDRVHLGHLPVTEQAGDDVTGLPLLIHVLVVVEPAVEIVLPVCVLHRQVDAHPLKFLYDPRLVVTVGTLEVLLPADDGVPLDAGPVEISATARHSDGSVLGQVLGDFLVTNHTISVARGGELHCQLPLSVFSKLKIKSEFQFRLELRSHLQ